MEISASFKDWERIAYYLHRLAAKKPPHKRSELKAAKRLGNLIAATVSLQRSKWLDEWHKWDRGTLEEFIYKQGKTPEEIAEIEGVDPGRVRKVLKRLNLLKTKTRKPYR